MIQIIFNSIQIVEYGAFKNIDMIWRSLKKKNINFEQ